MRQTAGALVVLLAVVGGRGSEVAAQEWESIPVRTTHVRGGVHAVFGAGANQSVALGSQGLFVVDAGYAEMGSRLVAAIRELGHNDEERRVAYLLDTHWHFDHVGANAAYAETGAIILAQDSTATLMSQDRTMPALGGLQVPATPPEARPDLNFTTRLVLPWDGDTIEVLHLPRAHTGGDAVVFFREADVVHLGDIFFNGMYPFIDTDHGGSLEGLVAAAHAILARTGQATLFIPGHGPLATRADFERYATMLRTVHRRMAAMIADGLSRAEAVAAKPTADLDGAWSRGGGFNDPDTWVGLVYDGYRRGPPTAGTNPTPR